ncbi:MAG: helix-turn-helix domain-containing protein [Solirubrobacterales bacterium]
MSILHKEIRARARQGREVSSAMYRAELKAAVDQRDAGLQQADQANARIESLLPGAVDVGVTVVELARLTGWSRPTVYRMLSRSRQQEDMSAIARTLEEDLARATKDFGSPAGLYNLAQLLGSSQEELVQRLNDVFPVLATELESLGSIGGIFLIDLLPSIPSNEKVVLAPLFLQRQSIEAVAGSVQQPAVEVVAWAALGLLRLLPEIRPRVAKALKAQAANG